LGGAANTRSSFDLPRNRPRRQAVATPPDRG